MPEFFKGWRREAGCVTLVTACVFVGMWVRSVYVGDLLSFPAFGTDFEVISSNGHVDWQGMLQFTTPIQTSWKSDSPQNVLESHRFEVLIHRLGRSTGTLLEHEEGSIPYWSVTLPLTFLSAWLLLRKPRSVKLKTLSVS